MTHECHCTKFEQTTDGSWFVVYWEDNHWASMMLDDYKKCYGKKLYNIPLFPEFYQ